MVGFYLQISMFEATRHRLFVDHFHALNDLTSCLHGVRRERIRIYDLQQRQDILEKILHERLTFLASDLYCHVIVNVQGEMHLFRVSLGILATIRKQLLRTSFEQCLAMLRRLPDAMDDQKLFANVYNLQVR